MSDVSVGIDMGTENSDAGSKIGGMLSFGGPPGYVGSHVSSGKPTNEN